MNDLGANAVLVFPDDSVLRQPDLPRIASAVRYRFSATVPIRFVAPAVGGLVEEAQALGLELTDPDRADDDDAEVWVFALSFIPAGQSDERLKKLRLPRKRRVRESKRIYFLEPEGFLHPMKFAADGSLRLSMSLEENPHIDGQVFSRLCPQDYFRGQSYFFPYNGFYVGHPTAFGPIDSFGFRDQADWPLLERRDPDHLVVGVFGGSSTWSPCCLQNETFASVLNDKLGEHLAPGTQRFRRASVINFGISSFTVLNELITYLLFCHRLKPEIVIAHDLFNDMANGILTDPMLLKRHEITYQHESEQWATVLHGPSNVELSQSKDPDEPFRINNSPVAVARAFLSRKRQFMNIVQANGAVFVYGLQPAWFGKRLSEQEASRLSEIKSGATKLGPIYRSMERLYTTVRDALSKTPPTHYVDIHGAFAENGPDDDFFYDHAHLFPAGDQRVAELYAEEIVTNILPKLAQEETT